MRPICTDCARDLYVPPMLHAPQSQFQSGLGRGEEHLLPELKGHVQAKAIGVPTHNVLPVVRLSRQPAA